MTPDAPTPETTHIALLRHLKTGELHPVMVPAGQSLEMDEQARRPWLDDHLGTEWCLEAFVPIESQHLEQQVRYWQCRFDKREAELDTALARLRTLEEAVREHRRSYFGIDGEHDIASINAKLWAVLDGRAGE